MAHYSPAYYTRGTIEVWTFIRDQSLNYHLGCAIKYICRAGYKDNKADDLKKAIAYLENELHATLSEGKSDGHGRRFPPGILSSVYPGSDEDPEAFDR
jgi:hypothetical protein